MSAARIGRPWGLGVDSAGNVYVNDYFNHTLRKITPAGLVTTLAGLNGVYGSADGPATAARFQFSVSGSGMALDAAGNIYIADADGNAIRCVTPGGFVGTILGDIASGKNRAGSLRDDVDLPLPSSYGALSIPMGVALGPDGSLYVTTANGIMKVTFTP